MNESFDDQHSPTMPNDACCSRAQLRKLTQLNRVRDLRELAVPPGNRLEALKGTRRGQHSIQINDQYRICFRWEECYVDDVEVTDYH